MNGSPAKMGTISGTAGHSSALKMRAEQNAAAAFQPSPMKSKEYDAAAKKDPNLGSYVAERKKIKAKYGGDRKKYRASEEYKSNQSKINKAYGIDDGYKAAEPTKTDIVNAKAVTKVDKINAKALTKTSEVGENTTKKVARLSKKDAKKQFGKGSKEHLAAKQAHLESKEADRQGAQGGKKQTFFRKLSSKRNLKRQEKNKAKIEALKAETIPVKQKSANELVAERTKLKDKEAKRDAKRDAGKTVLFGNLKTKINKKKLAKVQEKINASPEAQSWRNKTDNNKGEYVTDVKEDRKKVKKEKRMNKREVKLKRYI